MEVGKERPERPVLNILIHLDTSVLVTLFHEKRVQLLIACSRALRDANRNEVLIRLVEHLDIRSGTVWASLVGVIRSTDRVGMPDDLDGCVVDSSIREMVVNP